MHPLPADRAPSVRRMSSIRRTLAWAAAVLVVTGSAVAVTGAAGSGAAAPAGSFSQVTNFGSNPGRLSMYSYLPAGLPSNAPLVVALHGCTQSAADYYQHSGWAQYADQWGFAVVFPQQSSSNNPQSCFDWYTPSDDGRGQGEAESIHEMVSYAQSSYHVDAKRIYVTGLSAGGGMTSNLLADYPDVFAGGAIDSGLPAQCATSLVQATNCQYSNQNKTPAQWGDLVRAADPGYAGPWPRVAIWQGTADTTVSPVNATEERDQWTNVWGISQTPSSTRTLGGGTTESVYNDPQGQPAIELYSVSGMAHGLAVHPGSGADNCGSTGTYYLDYICSTYYTALFWGLNNGGGTPPPTTTTTNPPVQCFTDNNYAHTVAGRAYQSGGYAYAVGSNDAMGLWNVAVITSLSETSPGYYAVVPSC
ncbi:extracellular catalytic domain type 1 short-chain-length polyhydroxyalkanoate depolymerase [Kutzneria sp. CA-103260]|uniref:extracellular catalytic domain type 1 short-chain-length polyhydroxyalkanoate depolymerase n=1 Tax=Kutzneria sp. CA-103260 TaxID=2802641 RepID=UPI001BEFB299|nr:PHB depolymerase family esterase [Kutzneria sp. CA-103260]QUQ64327.1 feruloyl esterase [Kutzneria sp. CA-103260]